MRTAKKVFAIAALGLAVAFSASSVNAAPTTINIKSYIDGQGNAKDGTGGEKAVETFSIDGVIISAGAGSHALTQGAFVDESAGADGWRAYHDHGKAGMGVSQEITYSTLGTPGHLQSTDPADDNTQGIDPPTTTTTGTGEVLTMSLVGVGNYRIDELYFRNDGHTPEFGAGKTVGVSLGGTAGTGTATGDGSAGSWTNLALTAGVTDNNAIGALLTLPVGGIILSATDSLYLAFTNQQWYLSGFSFTLLDGNLNPVPLPAGILLLLSGLLGLGFLGRFRQKTA